MKKMIRPSWPLGTRFVDARRRVFEVTKVIMGNPDAGASYEIELENGWIIIQQVGNHPQTSAGFVDITKRDKLIIELIEDLDQFVTNGHLKVVGYDYSSIEKNKVRV